GPEIVEVEPIEGSGAAIMFEPRDVATHRLIDPSAGIARPRCSGLGQWLEKYLVGSSAAINADHEHDRASQQHCDAERTLGKCRRHPEEVVSDQVLAVDVSIREHADNVAAA